MTPVAGARPDEAYQLDPIEVTLRHIKRGTSSSPGAVQILGTYFYPDSKGLNGKPGFQSGNYERKLNEEGSFSITFPNVAGDDGELHRDRFAVIDEDRFRPGDEYIEVYRGQELVFVGCPVAYSLSKSQVVISGYSPFWLLKKVRETATGYWTSAPRDVLENYLSVWQMAWGIDATANEYSFSATTGSTNATSDGLLTYFNAATQEDGILLACSSTFTSFISRGPSWPNGQVLYGATSEFPHLGWRFEAHFRILSLVSPNKIVFLEGGAGNWPKMEISSDSITCFDDNWNSETVSTQVEPGDHHVAIEERDRWLYFYFDGKLVAFFASEPTSAGLGQGAVLLGKNGGANNPSIVVYNVLVRKQRPFLLNKAEPGDYALPGAPTPGGLEGHYHRDADIWSSKTNESFPGVFPIKYTRILHPTREVDPSSGDSGGLYQRRIDSAINFASGTAWAPPGPEGERFSCRWVGSVYIPFDTYSDFALRAVGVDNGIRIWIGKTRRGEEYLYSVGANGGEWEEVSGPTLTGKWLRAGNSPPSAPSGSAGQLAGQGSGWYPIVIEYYNNSGPGAAVIEFTRSDSPTFWEKLGVTNGNFNDAPLKLSPFGLYQSNVQFESHYDAFQNVASAFGYQWTEKPASLESGFFPGYVAPKARVGRDTDYILDGSNANEAAVQGTADDTADALLAEASGLGDPSQAMQMTAEVFDIPSLREAFFVSQEQESLSEVNQEALLLQRARSLLALRENPWEEVGAKPRGTRKLADTFPLSGKLAEFKWDPGDGLRLKFPEVKIEDKNPRQMVGVNQPFTPSGFGVPTANFRQRPRNMLLILRRMLKLAIAQKRNYQSQIVKVSGGIGSNAIAGTPDVNSRVNLPSNLSDVVRATVVVQTKSDASVVELTINGVNVGIKVSAPGRYDVTPYVKQDGANSRMYAGFIGGTGTMTIVLELLVRV